MVVVEEGKGGGFKGLAEQFTLHLLLEVSVVSLIDTVLRNTALSMVTGIILVEAVQFLWRKRRNIE